MILRSKSLSALFRESAKLQYSDAFIGDLAIANAFDCLVPAPAHSANWQPMCAITCTFIEVQTMGGYRFKVVLWTYERYIMPLYMYYSLVVSPLNVDEPYHRDCPVRKKKNRGRGYTVAQQACVT